MGLTFCQWDGCGGRSDLLLSWTCSFRSPLRWSNWASDLGTSLSLYFAQSLFSLPRDATGKIVCSSCHLQSTSVDFTGPQRLFIQGLREKPTSIFRAIRSNAQLRSDGTGPLQVGMVLVVGEGITIQSPGWLDWSATLAGALVLVPSSFRSVHQIPIGGECPICGSGVYTHL
jgi:hypothetical protein